MKHLIGAAARTVWAKNVDIPTAQMMPITQFADACSAPFVKVGNIVLDCSTKSQTTIRVEPVDKALWEQDTECIYALTRNGIIQKLGGTRKSMKIRWGSYLCGHCVVERLNRNGEAYPGKMSVTNAHLYHTIEADLLTEASPNWAIHCWALPRTVVNVEIMGEMVEIVAQTYHAYESQCFEKFRAMAGTIPNLCDNSDPAYRTAVVATPAPPPHTVSPPSSPTSVFNGPRISPRRMARINSLPDDILAALMPAPPAQSAQSHHL